MKKVHKQHIVRVQKYPGRHMFDMDTGPKMKVFVLIRLSFPLWNVLHEYSFPSFIVLFFSTTKRGFEPLISREEVDVLMEA